MFITAGLILCLILAYWAMAASFQKQVMQQFKTYLQSYPGTQANFEHASLSFLRSFPRVHLRITGLTFLDREKETLKIKDLIVLLNLRKIISDSIDVEQVVIRDAVLDLFTDEQGNQTQLFSHHDSSQAGTGTSVTLNSMKIELYNFNFSSENRAKKNITKFNVTDGRFVVGVNQPVTRISGEIKGTLDSLITRGNLIFSNLPVSSNNLVFAFNDSARTQALEQGFFMVESLKLVPAFSLSQKEDGMFIDWSISSENDLNAFLSIINLKEKKDLKQVNPNSKATIVFRQKGVIDALENPFTELDFSISEAKIEGKKMPYPVTDLFISGNYNNGEKHSSRSASISIDTLHARISGSFIDGKVWVNNLKDPQMRAKLAAKIDLEDIIKPTGLISATGSVTANLDINSKLNELEHDGFTGKELASGEVHLQNLDIFLKDSLLRVQIAEGKLNLEDRLLIINHIDGLLNNDPFYIEGRLSDFDNLITKQKIAGTVNAGFTRIDLIGLKQENKQDTTSGRFLEFLRGHLSLEVNTNIGILISQFGEMNNIKIQGKWEQAKFSVRELSLDYNNLNIRGDGFLSFNDNRIDSIQAKGAINGSILDFEDLQDIAEALGSSEEKENNRHPPVMKLNVSISLDTLAAGLLSFLSVSGTAFNTRTEDINFDISAQKMEYREIQADSVTFSGISSGAVTEIKSCKFSYGGGMLNLAGVFRSNEDESVTGHVISDANSVDMKQLLSSFGNFGQSFLTGDNISGNVSWTADLYFRLDSNSKTIDEENLWKFNFKVTDSHLSDAVPVEKALSFIRQKSKEEILVSNLEFCTFYIREKLYFQDVAIKNSVSDMNIFGTYSPKDTIADLDLQLSLSDLLFKSMKKRMIETEEGPLDVGNDKNLSLKFTGTIGEHHVKHIFRREFLKQRALMQSQFNEYDIELQKRISELSGGG